MSDPSEYHAAAGLLREALRLDQGCGAPGEIAQRGGQLALECLIGACAGVVCYFMVTRVKRKFGYDDALDAFGVHGAGGTLGAILTGVFATQVINPIFGPGKAVGGSDGHWGQIGNQLVGVLIAWGFALVGTLVLLKVVDLLTGLRVTEDEEIEGLDITQHGEEAYNLES